MTSKKGGQELDIYDCINRFLRNDKITFMRKIIAFGAILPSAENEANLNILKLVPAARWGPLTEVDEALIFWLTRPTYITGEIIHRDVGRNLI